jgi:hypothetical protein
MPAHGGSGTGPGPQTGAHEPMVLTIELGGDGVSGHRNSRFELSRSLQYAHLIKCP